MQTVKRLTIITALLIASCVTKAQLASERPVEDLLPPAMKARLAAMPRNNRVAVQPAQLASARGIPMLPPAVMARLRTLQANQRTMPAQVKQEQLASNRPVAEVDKLVKEQQSQARRNSGNKQ